MSIKLHGVTSQHGKHVTAVRSSDLNHKLMTPSGLFADTPTIKLLTHTRIRYLNLVSYQSDFGQDFKDLLTCEVIKVVIMMLLVTLVLPL